MCYKSLFLNMVSSCTLEPVFHVKMVICMNKTLQKGHIDHLDQKIIDVLATHGRMPVTELAKILGMSKTPCTVRLKRLISEEYILGFRAVLNPKKLDMSYVAFVEVKLHDTTEKALQAFNKTVQKLPEIEECHMIAGRFDYLLKVRTSNIADYRRVLGEKISALPHVANTSTNVTMESIKENGL